ncbi:DNA topoisomerase I [Candidatus Woesebacteria bacterium RIFOXYC1_FULL_31_51]|uniref:DNA topoisomerase 1 n=1 Tax=Candidatus Woesebacteria bacterium GW2011_GWC2_31_9 TaxID=1618586 RepID=A0A0F9YLZ4_9BACT|nr:MAG: topoisomerase I protein [Candidatus Woesebacteria bacterium GW2011_GWF1_31_35]KKP22815.1 MAG: topoisomerase protein [Candidatus Woesebacteria bacterium GW2011_GWC1_30_29]KKP26697.1 MAG: topoisomerase protein [Candidatus Woesebacteria bacterium GW2011_GWD1_31_12]KKP28063.1 MAG: topoisomerase protein [Candidatus Woesebacteria bacterium GW2011_GWB1_31_29]KKP32268.1 MAG: topoisomerase protein [Candidatus Woesebacteria bacterium GW2011_GWC2_31_9]KKP33620.1 MAG: topoisomerase protein [Candid
MQLIIVESPTKAKTLSRFLGSEFEVDSTRGHIKDLPKSILGVDIENDFKPDYVPVEKKKEVIASLKKKAKLAKIVYIATDPDREGEAIAGHVAEILSKSKLVRITFHEITKEAVKEAISRPGKVNENLVNAQISRRVLDRLVGYKISPLLWKKVRRGLSAGRVQSVAVRLIVERENEIKAFKTEEYWEVFAKFKDFTAGLINEKITNKVKADEILANLEKADYKVFDVKKREVKSNAYAPFTTSTMTQAGARIFGWSAKRTMNVAQRLYEEGLITYHRTDSMNLSIDAVNKARNFISKEYGQKYLPEKALVYKTKSKSAQEAHEAIRPTNIEQINEAVGLIPDEKKLYELIWKRFIACQMNPAIYSETTIDVEAKHKEGVHMLRASGQIMIFDGWRKLFMVDKEIIILPNLTIGESLVKEKVWSEQKFTLAPARFNEASLIKILEKLGIGRPSTYAPIISTIQIRSYVEKKEGKFFPTTIGFAVTEFLVKNFPIEMDFGFTAEMEENLDKIADGKIKWVELMKKFWKPFEKTLKSVEKNAERVKIETEKLGKACPDCKDGELVIRVGRFGKFISCSKFPDCKHTEKFLDKIGMKCPDCKEGDVIIKKSKKGNFFGCSKYPDCKFASWKKPIEEKS